MSADPGPMARLRDLQADPEAPGEIFRLLTEPPEGVKRGSLPGIARLLKLPKGRFTEWFSTTHESLYDTALKVIAAELALEAVDEAWSATPEDVQVRKLRADVALKLASKFDRQRYGEHVKVERSADPGDAAGFLQAATELLREIKRPALTEKVIEGESVPI